MTDAGESLRQFAEHMLRQYQQLCYTLQQNAPLLSGELRLCCSVTAAYSHLPPLLDRFRAGHPHVEIKLTTGDAADAPAKVQLSEADVAIAGRPHNLPASLDFFHLGTIPLVLIAPALACTVHQQATQETPNWAKIPFILPEQGPARHRIGVWFRHYAIANPLIYATFAGQEAMVSMVALGCGVALLPEVVLENSPGPVRHRVLLLNHVASVPPFEIGVCVQKKRLTEPLIRAFWQLL